MVLASMVGILLIIALFLSLSDGVEEEDILEHLIIMERRIEFLVCIGTIPPDKRDGFAINACQFGDAE